MFLFILYLSCVIGSTVGDTIIFNIIGDSSENVLAATKEMATFLKAMHHHGFECAKQVNCNAYGPEQFIGGVAQQHIEDEAEKLLKNKVIRVGSDRCVDRSIGQETPYVEHVTEILWALRHTMDKQKKEKSLKPLVLSLSFSEHSYPVFNTNFPQMFDRVSQDKSSHKLKLLEKTKELGSISDWHDLIVLMFVATSSSVEKWLDTLESVYLQHAQRETYTLLEPRPAIMEAATRVRHDLPIAYFAKEDLCVLLEKDTKGKEKRSLRSGETFGGDRSVNQNYGAHPAFCTPDVQSFLHISCMGGTDATKHACSTLHVPQSWKIASASPVTPKSDANMAYAISRYRKAPNKEQPLDFCWHSGDESYEKPQQSRLYKSKKESVPFKLPPRGSFPIHRRNITIISGSGSHSNSMFTLMPYAFSRMYYAHRNGYRHVHTLSNKYTPHYGHFFLNLVPDTDSYSTNLFAKPLMVLDQMHQHPESEWFFFLDDDVFFNPRFSDFPLEMYLEDVPDDKLFVLCNFRSAFTNAFFIRNTEDGRHLMRDWLGVVESGFIQCHGWDQAGMELLILSRMKDGLFPKTPTPFNHTCMNSRWALDPALNKRYPKEKLDQLARSPPEWAWGCDGQSSWSCDFRYENSLTRLGFHSRSWGFFMRTSSFSKGCANDYIPYFHTTFETAERPRLQCALCGDLDRIGSGEFAYDGHLAAGNDWIRRNAVNGWLVNHKALGLFFEAFLDPKNCKRDDDFIPKCDASVVRMFLKTVGAHSLERDTRAYKNIPHRMIKSLVDGYAYDFEKQTFCYGGEELYAFQKETTYMRGYAAEIAKVQSLSEEQFEQSRKEKLFPPQRIEDVEQEYWYFEYENFCEDCIEEYRAEFTNSRKGDHMVLNCHPRGGSNWGDYIK